MWGYLRHSEPRIDRTAHIRDTLRNHSDGHALVWTYECWWPQQYLHLNILKMANFMFFACSITTLKKVQCCIPEASDSKWMSYASIRLLQTHNRYRAKLGRKRNLECSCTVWQVWSTTCKCRFQNNQQRGLWMSPAQRNDKWQRW